MSDNLTSRFVQIYDTTLRDGAQGEGVSFSLQDKIYIVRALDELGISFAEAGNPGSNPKDMEFFTEIKKVPLKSVKVVAFGATRRKGMRAEDDASLESLLAAGTEYVCVFGKAWDFQVKEILRTTREENIAMISDTVRYLSAAGRKVIYDAEHFFDGYRADPDYALSTLEAAANAGAECLTLCDTNGGTLPQTIAEITAKVSGQFALPISIHCHNDLNMAEAASVMAVQAGASQVQGTFLGFGERCGNANLSSIIPVLELKCALKCLPEGHLSLLTPTARYIAEVANITLGNSMPFVGISAFTHKAGMHVDAVHKNPLAYEQISPESVGNERSFLLSEVSGRSAIIDKIRKFDPSATKESPITAQIIGKIKELECEGYQFEAADGSFELLVRRNMGRYRPFFKLHYYKVIDEPAASNGSCTSFAQVKIEVDGEIAITAGEGRGPVNALDAAFRRALSRFYPSVKHIRLTDFKVRVLDSASATAAKVRVLIETSDGERVWSTVGVSTDMIEASWLALTDSFEYKLILDAERRLSG